MNITDTEKQQIVELVVAYGAYNKAMNDERGPDRDRAMQFWGKMLIERQEQIGIEVIGPKWVENVLKHLEPPTWEMTI